MNTPPKRVVAIASGPNKGGYTYVMAAVYELAEKKDGTLVYKRSESRYGMFAHRSRRLATQDAEELAAQLKAPLWPHTRHWDTVEQAFAKTPEEMARKEAEREAEELS